MTEPLFRPETKELAFRIYSDLIGRNILVSDKGVQMPVSADNLATLSFKLAEQFLKVYDGLNEANMPKNPTFKLGVDDIAGWMK
jgi:hypothetical protein